MTVVGESWLERLGSDEATRDLGLAELRGLLLQNLKKSFSGRSDVSHELLEEVVQDALLKILENKHRFEGRSRFTTWATTIAIRTAFSELRRKKWQHVSIDQLLSEGQSADFIADKAAPPSEMTAKRQLIEDLYCSIESALTQKQRRALLAELSGMPLEELARRMGGSRNAVYKLTHDARKRLKKELEAMGYSSEDWQVLRR